ncbi:MAG TPA: ligase-associated DNA damage response endonuclease PdeM [Caulobacteraceae bacterium]|nr:ligase-associated DNA damage response endonuclease PdeM [Caulobacteraceae bacterium]
MSLAGAPHRYVFADHQLGGLALTLSGTPVICRPSGALWVEMAGALIVADLHLEKGSSFALRGQMLPPYDSGETLSRLEAEAAALAPRLIVLLGDTFHDRAAESRLSAADAARLRALAAGRSLVFVAGNHDAEAPRNLPGDSVDRLTVGGLDLVHEPSPVSGGAEVAGHLHPCARLRGYGMGVRRRCFVTDGERIVLPAFGAFAGGLNVRDLAFRPLFRRSPLAAILGAARVHAVGWRSLGGD